MLKKIMIVSLLGLALTGMLFAATFKEEDKVKAKAMVLDAIKYYDAAEDKSQALKDFQANLNERWWKGKYYIFVESMDAMMLVHGPTPKLVGLNQLPLRDGKGKQFNIDLIQASQKPEGGWVDYYWTNPATKKIAPKLAFTKQSADKKVFIGVGVYGEE